ncbi:MAG: hypothetical protein GY804_08595 [Alphaproteobacteria bacterium]|nr:hypothetical protein [Alphaproteobacteria bacterium]
MTDDDKNKISEGTELSLETFIKQVRTLPEHVVSDAAKKLLYTEADISDTMVLLTGQVDKIDSILNKVYGHLSEEERRILSSVEGSLLNTIQKIVSFIATPEGRLNQAIYTNDIVDDNDRPIIIGDNKPYKPKIVRKFKSKSTGSLTGAMATMAVIAKTSGLSFNPLFRSGFYVYQKPLSLDSLYEYYKEADKKNIEFGRMYSAHSLTAGSILLEQILCKAFHESIVESNLENWQDYDAFVENLLHIDFPAMVHGQVALMYPKGVLTDLNCISEEGDYKEKFIVNIEELRRDSIYKLSQTQLIGMMEPNRTPEQLQAYRDSWEQEDQDYEIYDGIKVTFTSPVMSERFATCIDIVNDIQKQLKSKQAYSQKDVVRIRNIPSLKPCIKRIDLLDEDGAVESSIVDYDAVADVIATYCADTDKIFDHILDFKSKQTVTHIGIDPGACKNCGEKTENDNYLQLTDILTMFFIGVRRRLVQQNAQEL